METGASSAEPSRDSITADNRAAVEWELIAKLKKLADMKRARLEMADRLTRLQETVSVQQECHAAMREQLIRDIAGENAYPTQCKCASPSACTCKLSHVSLKQLVRLKFQRFDNGGKVSFATTLALRVDQARTAAATRSAAPASPPAAGLVKEDSYGDDDYASDGYSSVEGADPVASAPAPAPGGEAPTAPTISQTEQRIKQLRAANSRLLEKEQSLAEEAATLAQQRESLRTLERQQDTFSNKYEEVHRQREKAEEDLLLAQEKIDALTDHIEKLMTHLQHEAAAKAKAFEATKRAQRELQDLKARNAALLKRNAERENLITELKEGTRILEDQLRLMDERYIDLRGKLDWTKAHASKQVTKLLGQTAKLEEQLGATGYGSNNGSGGFGLTE